MATTTSILRALHVQAWVFFFVSLSGQAQTPAERTSVLATAVEVPGLAVAVSVAGEVVYDLGFGKADLENEVSVTPRSRFRIASISKPLTAAAAMRLVEAGKLDLDQDIRHYLTDFPEKGARITSRHLGGHLAGIRHYRGEEVLLNRAFPDVRSSLSIFENDPLLHPPGSKFFYSSYAWNLLSAVMEKAASTNFESLMRREVFEPLQMIATGMDRVADLIPNRVRGYVRGPNGKPANARGVDNSYKWAGGGFLATASDLVRFGQAHHSSGYLNDASLKTLFSTQATSDGTATGYGFGWSVPKDEAAPSVVAHSGGAVGFTSYLLVDRPKRIVVALLANLQNAPIGRELAESIAKIWE